MYLKKMEIAGFKSFAERTTIEFDQGLTAVVGPNGSGKSNITDAIRWVLGEQSAKNLRGGKMPDVIFSGTQKRSPLNIAEVTLVLDNESGYLPVAYSEISVTRRLSRSGESDFFLNKQRCRLKDIVELFMDSGLGKESFSIISQGKVESIFNSKPEERRGIFEEAAGVLKYKQRKQQAEKKLLATDENLSRVRDIIYELEVQLEPLKAEREKAKQYQEWQTTFKQMDVGLMAWDISENKERWACLSRDK
ncbi:MAG: AAA family ATPase, partial [Vagococcus sp.]|nr:AAA family ATPase [Vagococcus sp.]